MNLLLIGVGRHSKRIHLPHIAKHASEYSIKVKCVVDLLENKNTVMDNISGAFGNNSNDISFIFLETDQHREIELRLSRIISDFKIDAAIVSCGPRWHSFYSKILLNAKVSVFCDKPISMCANAANNTSDAKKIYSSYLDLCREYDSVKKYGVVFSCLSQRRCHPAMEYIKSNILDVYEKTKVPVNSITCNYSDGQFRMPEEIANERYHGYTEGIGMCSHSGYHFFDICHSYIEAMPAFNYDEIEAYSSFIYPRDYFEQIGVDRHSRILPHYEECYKKTQRELNHACDLHGEIDAHTSFLLKRSGKRVCKMNISLLHSGFSARDWLKSKEDLYKGNGRLRHETHIINQGPMQTLYYTSYQSDQIGNADLENSDSIGGELHSEVAVFRNPIVSAGNQTSYHLKSFGKEMDVGAGGYSRGHQENARAISFLEFLDACSGKIPISELRTDLKKQEGANLLMSLAYQSAAQQQSNMNPVVNFKKRENSNGSI